MGPTSARLADHSHHHDREGDQQSNLHEIVVAVALS